MGEERRTGDLVGAPQMHVSETGDTFVDLARRYNVGYVELMAANPGVDPWIPQSGHSLIIPTQQVLPDAPRKGVVLNLSSLRLYYFNPQGDWIGTWPIGFGRFGLTTPTGNTKIVSKRANPSWTPTQETRADTPDLTTVVPPCPFNPLGKYALDLGWKTYLIHGTNKPPGVGRRVSRGCVRMYPEDIVTLFQSATIGTQVSVVDQPALCGWLEGELFIEAHPSQRQIDEIEEKGSFTLEDVPGLSDRVADTAGDDIDRVFWSTVEQAVLEWRGYPIQITQPR